MKRKPELKVYALYSTVANKNGLKVADVDSIHSWFLKNLVTTIKEKPMMSLHVPGMGRFSCDIKRAVHVALFNLDSMTEFLITHQMLRDKTLEEKAYLVLSAIEIINQFWERHYDKWDARRKTMLEEAYKKTTFDRELDPIKYPNYNKLKNHGFTLRIPNTSR